MAVSIGPSGALSRDTFLISHPHHRHHHDHEMESNGTPAVWYMYMNKLGLEEEEPI